MRNIKVSAKNVDMAIEKGLQMLGLTREEVEVEILCEGSMLRKAEIEMYTFASQEERDEYVAQNSKKKSDIKLVKTTEEDSIPDTQEGVNYEEIESISKDFLTGLFASMNMEVEIKRFIKNGDLCFRIVGDNVTKLIGFHGETLEAIQYILNVIVKNQVKGFRRKIFLDIEDYRKRRQDTLEEIAQKMAKKVLTQKKSIKLEPMNAFERKTIHYCLQNIEHIGTHSEGTEPNRCLVIDYVD